MILPDLLLILTIPNINSAMVEVLFRRKREKLVAGCRREFATENSEPEKSCADNENLGASIKSVRIQLLVTSVA